jgi:DNA polymerase-3 subunit epsilon
LFAPSIAFVDLETTGTSAGDDRVTEVGIVRVDNGARVSEWSSLVDPQRSIPNGVQSLTGITNAMVASAPTFGQVANEIAERLAGCVFVAHNARFDYGFLKQEFGRLGKAFQAKVVCTVKLSRRLYPDRGPHNLDAVIERHRLPVSDRHRALGDARVLLAFIQTVYREQTAEVVDAAIARILKAPSLPPQLAADALDEIPEAPGVYLFYGRNPLPLYIGKSINMRARIGSHFSSDYRNANDLRVSAEVTRIEFEETAGEIGALLRESELIKMLFPVYNQRLRRRSEMLALCVTAEPAPPDYLRSDAVDPGALEDLYGPFSTRQAARATLRHLASEAGLCWSALGLDRRSGPCFARQLKKCDGACVGAETPVEHHQRLRGALARYAFKPWPYRGTIAVREANMARERTDVHLFRDWCWLGTAHDEGELGDMLEHPRRPEFDLDVYRVLTKRLPRAAITVVA